MGLPADLRVELSVDPKYKIRNEANCLVGNDHGHLTEEQSWLYSFSGDDNSDCFAVCEDEGKKDSSLARSIYKTYSQTVPTDSVHHGSDNDADRGKVVFLVGRDVQPMIGQKSQLAEVSPVFKAMFESPLQEAGGVVTVPDVEPGAFHVLLRFAARDQRNASDFDLDLADPGYVWEVLKASDKYDVSALTDTCFRFLLQQHPRHRRSHHLCSVLELAHRLNYTQHHQQALIHVKQHAARVLKNSRALAELCPQCMLSIVTADDLKGVDEILVHDAVLFWARHAYINQRNLLPPQEVQLSSQICVNHLSQLHLQGVHLPPFKKAGAASPSWIELRSVAGDLVRHVRYLTIHKHTLAGFRVGDPSSCLLTAEEMKTLLKGDASLFPDTVRVKRGKAIPAQKSRVGLRKNR